jgi:hypothetical protein
MNSRFSDSLVDTQTETPSTNGFLLFAVPAMNTAPQTTMQWFYQRLYEEAAKANQPTPSRELFKVMN